MDSPTGRIPHRKGGSWRDWPPTQSVSGSTVGGNVEQHSYGETHPKDRNLPGFTHDSAGNGVSGVDTGLADFLGNAMFGHEHWEAKKKRSRRNERLASALRFVLYTGCLTISILIAIAAVLGLVLLVIFLWSLL